MIAILKRKKICVLKKYDLLWKFYQKYIQLVASFVTQTVNYEKLNIFFLEKCGILLTLKDSTKNWKLSRKIYTKKKFVRFSYNKLKKAFSKIKIHFKIIYSKNNYSTYFIMWSAILILDITYLFHHFQSKQKKNIFSSNFAQSSKNKI